MAIKNVSGFQQTLQNFDAKSWAKSSEIGTKEPLGFKDAPQIPFEKGEVQKSFGEFLLDSMSKVNELQSNANVAMEKLATGKSQNIHETMLAVEQAEVAFKTMNQVRSKVIDIYKEMMKMQI